MSYAPGALALTVSVALFAYGSWRSSRPADPLRPRLIPWRTVLVGSGAVAVLALIHLASVAGLYGR